MARQKVISLELDNVRYREALDKIVTMAQSRTPGYVCFANVHMTIEAFLDATFAGHVNRSALVLSDGVPLIKTLKFFYGSNQERVAGMDAMPDLIALAREKNLKIFFFGTTPEILSKVENRARQEYPGVEIAGIFSPPFGKSLNDESYIRLINDSGANLVFVALGCPKQEKWMAENTKRIQAVLLGVGGAFPVYAGIASRAPQWMQKAGLEWFYRFCQEPGRLFKRYLVTNSLYIYLVFKFKLNQWFQRGST